MLMRRQGGRRWGLLAQTNTRWREKPIRYPYAGVQLLISPSNISNNVQVELGRATLNAGFVVEDEFAIARAAGAAGAAAVVDELDRILRGGVVFGRVCYGGRAGDARNRRLCSRALELDTTLAARDPPLLVNMMGDTTLCVQVHERENAKTKKHN